MKKAVIFVLFSFILINLFSQGNSNFSLSESIEHNFARQLQQYPQEKLYIQTDKRNFILGDKVWIRAYLVESLLHKKANASRYVYVELIDPLDSIVKRVKIKPDEEGYYYGYLPLDEDLSEGNYTLRAYTNYMRNQNENYFFKKSIYVANPLSASFDIDILYTFDRQKVKAIFSFYDKSRKKILLPKVELKVNDRKKDNISFNRDSIIEYSFNLNDGEKRVINIELEKAGKIYKRYFQVPYLDNDFDVSFFPEGGNYLNGTGTVIGFKAIKTNELAENISGKIVDEDGNEYQSFKSVHLGMGTFYLHLQKNKKYFAVCENEKGISKYFEIKTENKFADYGLKINQHTKAVFVSVLKSADTEKSDSLYLLIHSRGVPLYYDLWDPAAPHIPISYDFFPSGITSFLLLDSYHNIISERMFFHLGDDQAQTAISTDKDVYGRREQIQATVNVSQTGDVPLTGTFSVAVTDNADVKIDTCVNILSTLLLASELKGHIESPASYLTLDKQISHIALNALMLTQGWRRYNVPEVLRGKIEIPEEYEPETTMRISGKIEALLGLLKQGDVSMLAMYDTINTTFFTTTDQNGHFTFTDFELRDSTMYLVQALTKKGNNQRIILKLDEYPYPQIGFLPPIADDGGDNSNADYLRKADQMYMLEHGMRFVDLKEITVTGKRKEVNVNSIYYSPASSSLVVTSEDIENSNANDIASVFMQVGAWVSQGRATIRGYSLPALIVIDDVPYEDYDLNSLLVRDINGVFVLKDAATANLFGGKAAHGAIIITTKRGLTTQPTATYNIKRTIPLGYQEPIEFYSPKYGTEQEKSNPNDDLRTTIYWNPCVKITEGGIAMFDFYSADMYTEYSIVIEGLTDDGRIIHSVSKVERK